MLINFYQCSTGTRPPGWGARPPRFPRTRDGGAPGETFPHVPLLGKLEETQGSAFPQCGGHVSPKWVLLGVPPPKGVLLDAQYFTIYVSFMIYESMYFIIES
jgi:hypothetical protein